MQQDPQFYNVNHAKVLLGRRCSSVHVTISSQRIHIKIRRRSKKRILMLLMIGILLNTWYISTLRLLLCTKEDQKMHRDIIITTYRKCRVMNIIFKDRVKFTKQPMFRSIISAVTQIKTTNESSYFPTIPRSCVKNHTLLMMRKKGSNNLELRNNPVKLGLNLNLKDIINYMIYLYLYIGPFH